MTLGVFLPLGPPSGQSQEIQACLLTHVHTHLCLLLYLGQNESCSLGERGCQYVYFHMSTVSILTHTTRFILTFPFSLFLNFFFFDRENMAQFTSLFDPSIIKQLHMPVTDLLTRVQYLWTDLCHKTYSIQSKCCFPQLLYSSIMEFDSCVSVYTSCRPSSSQS